MWIKVCGIRNRETALQLAQMDVDAIGLNFFNHSPRVVSIEEAIEITRILPPRMSRVGLFVNHSVEDVESISRQCKLDFLQLHGDETVSHFVELSRRLPKTRLIRAWRMGAEGLSGLKRFLDDCHSNHLKLAGCLIDACVPGVYGGSGKTVAWEQLVHEYDLDNWPPLILAGGLKPSNITAAIAATSPWGVDVASGVESSPGIKDFELVRQFVSSVRLAQIE